VIWLGTDALVVGAGPTGLIFAEKAASQGLDVKVLEEHDKVGMPNHCTGLISVDGLKKLGLTPSAEMIQQKISGAYLYSPNGNCIEVREKRVRAYAIDRVLFDQKLAQKAIDAGALLKLGQKVDSLIISKKIVKGAQVQGLDIISPLTINAEGSSRRLLRKSNFIKSWKPPIIGVNAELRVEVDPGMAEIWFSEKIAPGFFAWVIPLEGSYCRVGLASNSGLVLDKLNSFIKKRFGLSFSFKPRVGQILVDGPLQKTSFDGLLLIGDVAGQVKPTTGGGVVIGGLCAFEAAKIAVKAVEKSDTSSELLEDYDNSWKNLYQNEFRSMKMLRNVADRINDNQIDRAFKLFKEEGMNDKLLSFVSSGDMDLQNSVIRKALTDPKILLLLTRILGKLMLDEMLQFVNV
jgi:digeranylgeranylglycerophospholipid reductase